MSTKALKGQLVAAIAMTLVAAIALGSSTFAWFAANTTVHATGLEVNAKTDTTYLLITNDETASNHAYTYMQAHPQTSVAFTWSAGESTVDPSAPALSATEAGYLTVSGKQVGEAAITVPGVQVNDAAKAATVTNWYTAHALTTNAAAIDTTTARQLTTFDGYVLHKQVWLTLQAGSTDAYNLTVKPTFTQNGAGNDLTAAKVLVITDGNYTILSSAENDTAVSLHATNNNAITASAERLVDIYVYYDGNATPVYTENSASLTGVGVSLQFDVDTTAPSP